MILGYSRMRYVEFTTDISTENVIKMHLNAFSFFGGFTDTILYDNMKQIVIDRKIKASESGFNQKFMDFAECTVYLKMRQNTKRIKRYFPPLHLLFFS